jgi:hypothetical protein
MRRCISLSLCILLTLKKSNEHKKRNKTKELEEYFLIIYPLIKKNVTFFCIFSSMFSYFPPLINNYLLNSLYCIFTLIVFYLWDINASILYY